MLTPEEYLRAKKIYMAILANEAGRHAHAVRFMIDILNSVAPWAELTKDEINVLRVVLRKFVDGNRDAWCAVNEKTLGWCGKNSDIADYFLRLIEGDIFQTCREIKHLISRRIVISAQSAESKVYCLAIQGEVCFYMAELRGDDALEEEEAAFEAYDKAKALAKAELTWLSPARLILAFNMALFYYVIQDSPQRAVRIATKAVKNAYEAGSDSRGEGFTKETEEMLTRLKAGIVNWSKDLPQAQKTTTSISQIKGLPPVPKFNEGAGTSTSKAARPFIPSKEAGASGTKAPLPGVAGKEAGTHGIPAAPPPVPGEEAGSSEILAAPPHPPCVSSPLTICRPPPVLHSATSLPPPPLPSLHEDPPEGVGGSRDVQDELEEPMEKRRKLGRS